MSGNGMFRPRPKLRDFHTPWARYKRSPLVGTIIHTVMSGATPRSECRHWVTGCLPDYVSATAGVPQTAAYLQQHHMSAALGPGRVKTQKLEARRE
jgi:hypothetical protein